MLVPIEETSHKLLLRLAYATEDNFTGKPVYKRHACFLHPDAEKALKETVRLLDHLNLKLVIYDAFRPTEAQQILWDHTPDPTFLAPPERGSNHSRGVAVDLGLMDADGTILDMGTAFDAFTPLSFHGVSEGISAEALANRSTLLGVMVASGWVYNPKEWWHYQLPDAQKYPLISDFDSRTGLTKS